MTTTTAPRLYMTENLNSKSIASYKTKEGLLEAIDGIGASDHRFICVQREDGRWTAIFAFSNIQDGNLFRYAVTKKTSFMIFG